MRVYFLTFYDSVENQYHDYNNIFPFIYMFSPL